MELIKITSLERLFRDDRGETFYIFNDRSGDFLLSYRNAGSSSGRHYHTGRSPYKDPEILYLLSGEALIRCRKIADTTMQEIRITAPAKVEIPANIWHELVAVTDCSFWEMNSLEDVKDDSVKLD